MGKALGFVKMKYDKIYIVVPEKLETGGPETFHQMCGVINDNHFSECYIVYINVKNFKIVKSEIPERYKKYNVLTTDSVEDSPRNLLMVAEGETHVLKHFKHITKMVCWLSLLYHYPYKCSVVEENYKKHILLNKFIRYLFRFMTHPKRLFLYKEISYRKMKNCRLSYNCLCEKEYLSKKGLTFTNYLCGPISDDYFESGKEKSVNKEKIISYNPKKGKKFALEVIASFKKKYGNSFTFVPIENMTNLQVINTLKKSSLYIDFGYFPGHERIPRQAVLLHTNVLTSRFGAAGYKDIVVPEKFKLDANVRNIENIVDTMFELASNPDEYYHEYDKYREFTNWQRDNFFNEIKAICEGTPFILEEKFNFDN